MYTESDRQTERGMIYMRHIIHSSNSPFSICGEAKKGERERTLRKFKDYSSFVLEVSVITDGVDRWVLSDIP
jgi:hypothetical protein